MKKEDELHKPVSVALVGHVDHGKSTILGRLLAETDALPEGKLKQVIKDCKINSKKFEYAFLIDALKEEQAQGITIDVARCFFKTQKRKYLFLDAPGHIEFIKNMVTGAAHADAALVVIDANEGIKENSLRHGFLLSFLNISQIVILVNKMDLVGYDEKYFTQITEEYERFLKSLKMKAFRYIPVSGFKGDNIIQKSSKMNWYKGETILEILDSLPQKQDLSKDLFRMPVQDIYKFTHNHDNRRIIAGSIISGELHQGDRVIFFPSYKKSKIQSLAIHDFSNLKKVASGSAIGVILEDSLYLSRGEMMAKENEKSLRVSYQIKVKIFWMGRNALQLKKRYFLKIATAKVGFEIKEIQSIFDTHTFNKRKGTSISQNEIAECILKLEAPIAFDLAMERKETSRFVIIDEYQVSGGGLIYQAIEQETELSETEKNISFHWSHSHISPKLRKKRFGHGPAVIFVTGEEKEKFSSELEKMLFDKGYFVHCIGYEKQRRKKEKLFDVLSLFINLGIILIIKLDHLSKEELMFFQSSLLAKILSIGAGLKQDLHNYDIYCSLNENWQKKYNLIEEFIK